MFHDIVNVMLYCLSLASLDGKGQTSWLFCVDLCFCHFLIWCLGLVYYLIVWIPGRCLPLYFHVHYVCTFVIVIQYNFLAMRHIHSEE